MAKLTAAQRKAIPARKFALGKGHFPIEDISHARAAIQDAPKSVHAGNITPGQAATVRRKAKAAFPSIKLGGRGK